MRLCRQLWDALCCCTNFERMKWNLKAYFQFLILPLLIFLLWVIVPIGVTRNPAKNCPLHPFNDSKAARMVLTLPQEWVQPSNHHVATRSWSSLSFDPLWFASSLSFFSLQQESTWDPRSDHDYNFVSRFGQPDEKSSSNMYDYDNSESFDDDSNNSNNNNNNKFDDDNSESFDYDKEDFNDDADYDDDLNDVKGVRQQTRNNNNVLFNEHTFAWKAKSCVGNETKNGTKSQCPPKDDQDRGCPSNFWMTIAWIGVYLSISYFLSLVLLDILLPGCPWRYILVSVAVAFVLCSVSILVLSYAIPSAPDERLASSIYLLLIPFIINVASVSGCYCFYVWNWAEERQRNLLVRFRTPTVGGFSGEPDALHIEKKNVPRPPTLRADHGTHLFEEQDIRLISSSDSDHETKETTASSSDSDSDEHLFTEHSALLARHTQSSTNVWNVLATAKSDQKAPTESSPLLANAPSSSSSLYPLTPPNDRRVIIPSSSSSSSSSTAVIATTTSNTTFPLSAPAVDHQKMNVLSDDEQSIEIFHFPGKTDGEADSAVWDESALSEKRYQFEDATSPQLNTKAELPPAMQHRLLAIRQLTRDSWTHKLSHKLFHINAHKVKRLDNRLVKYRLLGTTADAWTVWDQDKWTNELYLTYSTIVNLVILKVGIWITWVALHLYLQYVVSPLTPNEFWYFFSAAAVFLVLRAVFMIILTGLNARLPSLPEIRFFVFFAGQMYFEMAFRALFLFAGNYGLVAAISGLNFAIQLFSFSFQLSRFWFNLFQVRCRRMACCRFTQFCFMDPDRKGHELTYESHIANKSIRFYYSCTSKAFSLMAFLLMFLIIEKTPWIIPYYPSLQLYPDRMVKLFYTYFMIGGIEVTGGLLVSLIAWYWLRVDMGFHARIATILDTRTRFVFAIALLVVYMDTPLSLVSFSLLNSSD